MRILVVSQYFWPEDFRINEFVKDFKKKKKYFTHLQDVLVNLVIKN